MYIQWVYLVQIRVLQLQCFRTALISYINNGRKGDIAPLTYASHGRWEGQCDKTNLNYVYLDFMPTTCLV